MFLLSVSSYFFIFLQEKDNYITLRLQDLRSKKDLTTSNIDDNLTHDEFEKRASRGFQGMRGKKDYLTSDFKDFYLRNDYEKRAPMSFQGMRGKKAVSEDGYYKRAPMGFQGMRGKKSMGDVSVEHQ